MTTPQQFLECFLQEKTAAFAEARPRLKAVFEKYFGEPLLRHAEHFMPRGAVHAIVEDVKLSGVNASAVTREHFRTADLRMRYRLAASGDSWKITGIDRECFMCRGTGQSNGAQCWKCGGEGWLESKRDVA